MCTSILSFANTGLVNISTANSNLNGSGSLGTVLTALDSGQGGKGTVINLINIKATGSTTQGMVRLFIDDGVNTRLYKEIYVPAVTQTAVQPAFLAVLNEEINLDPGCMLKASTQNAESFNIMANGTDWKNCDCVSDIECSDMQYFANTGIATISTANSNLNGSGTIDTVLTAANSGALASGTQIPSVTVKASGSTTLGMVRLFVSDGVTNFLIRELQIPEVAQTNVEPAYRGAMPLGIFLQPGYILKASTENAESFNIIAMASDWVNCDCAE